MNNKKNNTHILVLCLVIIGFLILIPLYNNYQNNKSYNYAEKLINSGRYFAGARIYQELNDTNQDKLGDLLTEEINNTKWKEPRKNNLSGYDFGSCTGYRYAEVKKETVEIYCICEGDTQKHEITKGKIIDSKKEDNKLLFTLGGSGYYLGVDTDNNIFIASYYINTTTYKIGYDIWKKIE